MRIRKHAKISPLLYTASSLNIQTHVCQLNQSPWDVITFSPPPSPPPPPPQSPPPLFQVKGSCVSARNGSSDHFVSVGESESYCVKGARFDDNELSSRRRSEYRSETHNAGETEAEEEKKAIKCCKTDGKSWHCRREAAEGNSLCEHHLSLSKSYTATAAEKKSVHPAAESQRRTRPKKAQASTSSNPYEFYYYSGFGPRWGKRRGETQTRSSISNNKPSMRGGIPEFEMEGPPPLDGEFDFIEYEEDDDDDDDEEERLYNGKKRVRKPIKARSLKSLL